MELKVIAAEHIVATGNKDGRWTNVYVTPLADAQATVEALQRERDQWKEAFERSCDDTAHLKAALDAEREKVQTLRDERDRLRDEFMRIKALNVNGEVNGICDRAVKDIERRVSVISELESTLELLAKANQSYEDIRLNRDNVITQAIARESLLIRKLHEKDRQLGLLEQQLCNFQEEIDRLRGDARRYRWLCDDHSSAQVREKRKDLLKRMSVMSYSAISTDIDAAIAQQNTTSFQPTNPVSEQGPK